MLDTVLYYLMDTTRMGVLLSVKELQVSATALTAWRHLHWCSRVSPACISTQQEDPEISNALVTSVTHVGKRTGVRKVM